MVQFHKSKKFGPVRITASKKGLGVSVGAGPVRVGLGADGKVRRTLRLPGPGIYDTKVVAAADEIARPEGPVTSKPEVRLEKPPIAPCQLQPVALTQPISAKGHNGTVTFDGWWIDIERSGTLARLAATVNSYKSKRIPLDGVEHVEWKQPSTLINGYLRVVRGGERRGGRARMSVWAANHEVLAPRPSIPPSQPESESSIARGARAQSRLV
ncbi:DUF4236 domain-containing protein [Nocardia abscessus]|uniref:DUF4236 domain-containing protein n=1 Tax=Nocardia abscessus TaxID=120957 RepID=UPI0018959B08|nr:DUF4236 domain-containing protein [Nocardia abscessus]MBF6221805.1 DUF4236 domain-containing protein [Nocardia abscessus]